MQDATCRYYSFVADSDRWNGFEFRDGDIIISTPPKCGTTWTQMILALLIFQAPDFDRPLSVISPWLDMLTSDLPSITADLAAQGHRRFIKTHTPLDGLPFDERVSYICVGRDPRDVGLSWDDHMANMDLATFIQVRTAAVGLDDLAEVMPDGPPRPPLPDPRDRFWQWVDDDAEPTQNFATLRGTLHHLDTFWRERERANIAMLHYSDLSTDLDGQMRRLANWLGIKVPEDRWPALVEAACFDRMKARADDLIPNSTHGIWLDNKGFFSHGRERWRSFLDKADLDRYQARVALLAAHDLSAWAQDGWLGSSNDS